MLFTLILDFKLDPFLKQNLWLIVLIGCIVLALGILIGYLLGNTSLKKFFYEELENAEHQGTVQKSVTENVGLGIIVYDKNDTNGPVYVNKSVEDLKGFIKNGIPRTLDIFLDTYDRDNHLKSDYLISIENGADEIRTNYVTDNCVYEIKILRRDIEYASKNQESDEKLTETLDIILIDDITKIKDDERRQKDLAANVSHELKTPLTVIRSSEHFVEKIKHGNMPTYEELEKWSTRILNNAIRMQDIVEDFLVLSNNSQTKHMGTFDFYDVVEQSIANLNDYPAAKSVTIVPPKEDSYSLGFGNSKLIVRIVTNLLTNAVKYIDYPNKTEPHVVNVNIVETVDSIGIQVADNGRGIPSKDKPHLFERFYRVDNSGSREVGGSGLGLAIAKELADIHDGTIDILDNEKIQEQRGSVFTLFLPKASTVFERVYEDSKAGVAPEIEFYSAVLRFLVFEAREFADSNGYSDILETINNSGWNEDTTKIADSDKIKIITALGDEKFARFVDDLTYVEVFDDEEDEEYDEYDEYNEYEEIENNNAVTPIEQPFTAEDEEFDQKAIVFSQDVLEALEAQRIAEEEEMRIEQEKLEQEEIERQKKKEARELLMQPVVQQSVKQSINNDKPQTALTQSDVRPDKSNNFTTLEQKGALHIHPNTEKKGYNNTGVKFLDFKSKAKKETKAKPKPDVEPLRSAVRQVLDEAEDSKIIKSNDTEGNK